MSGPRFINPEDIGLLPYARTEDSYSLSDGWGAAFRTENVLGSTASQLGWGHQDGTFFTGYEKDGDDQWIADGWTPQAHLDKYVEPLGENITSAEVDGLWAYMHDAQTPAEARQGMNEWSTRRRDTKTLANMDFRDQLIVLSLIHI